MSAGDVAAAILSSLKFIHTNFVASPRLEDEAAKAIAQRWVSRGHIMPGHALMPETQICPPRKYRHARMVHG
jgi:hypothetical protein